MPLKTRTTVHKDGGQWWLVALLLFSMLTEGLVIPVFGRAPNLSLFDLLFPPIFLYLLIRDVLGNVHVRFPDKWILFLGIAYFMAHLLSMLVNYLDILRGVVAIKIFVFGFLMYWVVAATVRSKPALERATSSLVFWGAIMAIVLIARFIAEWSSTVQGNYEIKDQIELTDWARSNYLAALLVPIVPIAVGSSFAKSGFARFAMIMAAAAMSFGLLITMSKGAILSLFLGSLCAIPVLRQCGMKMRHLAILLVCIVAFLLIVPTDLISANYDLAVYRAGNPDFNRLDLWRVAWQQFLKNPILGVGPYCIYIYNQQFANGDLYSHNFILNALADLGLTGAIPFFAIVWIVIRRSYTSCKAAAKYSTPLRWMPAGLFIGLTATLFHGMVEPTFQGREYSVIFWVCACLIYLYDPRKSSALYSMASPHAAR